MAYEQKIVGENISRYRNAKDFSQDKLAKSAGCSQGYIGDLEVGKGGSISLSLLQKISNSLNVDIDALLGGCLDVYDFIPEKGVKDKLLNELQTCNNHQLEMFNIILKRFIEYKSDR